MSTFTATTSPTGPPPYPWALPAPQPVQCEYCGVLGAHFGDPCPLLLAEHDQRKTHREVEHRARLATIKEPRRPGWVCPSCGTEWLERPGFPDGEVGCPECGTYVPPVGEEVT
jgi:hypothetical protein